MRQRIRAWFRDQPLGLVIPVGVVVGYAAWSLLIDVAQTFVWPLLFHWESGDVTSSRLTFHLGNVKFDYTLFAAYVVAFIALCAIVYYVFIEAKRAPDDDIDTRDCPECKNEIWADATRCGFCTAVVEPLLPSEQATAT